MKKYTLPDEILPVVVGYSYSSNMKAVKIAKDKYPYVLGIAPQTAIKSDISKLNEWVEYIRQNTPNAIGEVGLDYKWPTKKEEVEREIAVFKRMINLSKEMKLPLVIHSRNNPSDNNGMPKNAVRDILDMVNNNNILMHCYSGSEEEAKEIISMGGYISIIPMRSKERKKVINTVPIDRLMVESDSPYIGRTPESIKDAIKYISEIKCIDFEEVATRTNENAARFFGFDLS
ncbi:TatD family hydrolase [Candidatus Micrarchaeota archaeon]|nr:TatD family hydrolase [Candidatus Micrarchaeota archaeon]